MTKEDILDYVMNTPNNTNRIVLNDMLNELQSSGGTETGLVKFSAVGCIINAVGANGDYITINDGEEAQVLAIKYKYSTNDAYFPLFIQASAKTVSEKTFSQTNSGVRIAVQSGTGTALNKTTYYARFILSINDNIFVEIKYS